MTWTVSNIYSAPGPTGSTPFNETSYAANALFASWGGKAKGGWVVTGELNPDNIPDGNQATETITVPGVELGDHVELAISVNPLACMVHCYVDAADTVKVLIRNESGVARNIEVGPYTLRITDLT